VVSGSDRCGAYPLDQSGNVRSAPRPVVKDMPHTPEAIRELLTRKSLSATRHRTALARLLGMTDTDVLAVQHLSRAGSLTPTRLGDLLGLTSGGTTALVQRLERLGYVVRDAHPSDRRSAVLRLTGDIERAAGEAFAPLVEDIDAITACLSEDERRVIAQFLSAVADAGDHRADELSRSAREERRPAAGVPMPGLWG
jgi:DNA-binding MarR family transcriptional regulator